MVVMIQDPSGDPGLEPDLIPSPTPSTRGFPRVWAWAGHRSGLPGGPEYRRARLTTEREFRFRIREVLLFRDAAAAQAEAETPSQGHHLMGGG